MLAATRKIRAVPKRTPASRGCDLSISRAYASDLSASALRTVSRAREIRELRAREFYEVGNGTVGRAEVIFGVNLGEMLGEARSALAAISAAHQERRDRGNDRHHHERRAGGLGPRPVPSRPASQPLAPGLAIGRDRLVGQPVLYFALPDHGPRDSGPPAPWPSLSDTPPRAVGEYQR